MNESEIRKLEQERKADLRGLTRFHLIQSQSLRQQFCCTTSTLRCGAPVGEGVAAKGEVALEDQFGADDFVRIGEICAIVANNN